MLWDFHHRRGRGFCFGSICFPVSPGIFQEATLKIWWKRGWAYWAYWACGWKRLHSYTLDRRNASKCLVGGFIFSFFDAHHCSTLYGRFWKNDPTWQTLLSGVETTNQYEFCSHSRWYRHNYPLGMLYQFCWRLFQLWSPYISWWLPQDIPRYWSQLTTSFWKNHAVYARIPIVFASIWFVSVWLCRWFYISTDCKSHIQLSHTLPALIIHPWHPLAMVRSALMRAVLGEKSDPNAPIARLMKAMDQPWKVEMSAVNNWNRLWKSLELWDEGTKMDKGMN